MNDLTTPASTRTPSPYAIHQQLLMAYKAQREQVAAADREEFEARWRPLLIACESFTEMWATVAAHHHGDERETLIGGLCSIWQNIRSILGNAGLDDLAATWDSIQPLLPAQPHPAPTPDELTRAVRAPRGILSLINDVRAGAVHPPRMLPPNLFLAPQHERWMYWEFKPHNSPLALALPLPSRTRPNASLGVTSRSILNPSALRAYLASLCLALEHNRDGYFPPDYKRILFDYFGVKPRLRTLNGRQYAVLPSTPLRLLQGQFDLLGQLFLVGTPKIQLGYPQPLLTKITVEGAEVWQHASLAWQLTKRSFTQVPRAVLRLDPVNVPLALGIANLWRQHIVPSVLKGPGHYRAELRQLAEALGEDVDAELRRSGSVYWTRLVADLETTLKNGDLETLSIGAVAPHSQVTLTPSMTLANGYQPLVAAQARAAARAAEVDIEVAIRAKHPPRSRGRRRTP